MAPVIRLFSRGLNFDFKENDRYVLHSIEVPLLPPKKKGESPKRKQKLNMRIIYSTAGGIFQEFTVSKNMLPIFTK